MDIYGIGSSLEGFAHGFLNSPSTKNCELLIVRALKSGDVVVCAYAKDRSRYVSLILENGISGVDVVLCDPAKINDFVCRGQNGKGVYYFDRGFIESYYRISIQRAHRDLDDLQTHLSRGKNNQSRPPSSEKPMRGGFIGF